MAVKLPSPEQLLETAAAIGLSLTDADVVSFLGLMAGSVASYNAIDAMPDHLPEVKYPRTPGRRPAPEQNPHNAWYVQTTVKGAAKGKLKGKTVVLKDNIMLAGVPMMNGASILEGYTPEIDAILVTRILDEAGTIVGKAHCEYYCLSGGSHTCAAGPVHNPHRMGYSAGGSSSGSAVLVALGEVDMAIGGDQGGSIRMPSSYCGTYGMKPTHGLVPYTGIMPIEPYIDHAGPITANVEDNALLLEVIAGADGIDPRQYNVKTAKYTQALDKGVKKLRIGLLQEGFGLPFSEPDVDAKVQQAAKRLAKLGATVKNVTIPMFSFASAHLWAPIAIEGTVQTMMEGDGYGLSRQDLYVTSLMDHQRQWRQRANELSETMKLIMLTGTYINKHHGSRYYGKAVNLTRKLMLAIDEALEEVDVLLLPTTPMKATPLPPADAPRELIVQRAFEQVVNTIPFDISHHPAMAVPCGLSDGLPVSMMLVARHFDESTIYRVAHAFAQDTDWRKL